MRAIFFHRSAVLFALVALIGAFFITRLIEAPAYTDAFYHYNAAQRLATGQGLTDTYLWTYIGAPESRSPQGDFPSHIYWMPMTSLTAALGMAVGGVHYPAAQIFFIVMLAAVGCLGYGLGAAFGGNGFVPKLFIAWSAGLITLFSGFFTRFWGTMDTFAPYAFWGAFCLLVLCLLWRDPIARRAPLFAFGAGILGAMAHLTRADGVLIPMIGGFLLVAGAMARRYSLRQFFALTGLLIAGYGLGMLPWIVRNLAVIGTPLPTGGVQAIWLTGYNDLFNYPAENMPARLLALGFDGVWATRWVAFVNNLGTLVAVEGLIVMTPLMFLALWRRRLHPFWQPFALYAVGLHVVMTIVFPFPGYRGGLLHSAAALIPFWAILGVLGIGDVVAWAARRRRWNAPIARTVFTLALVVFAIGLSLWIGGRGAVGAWQGIPGFYAALDRAIPPDARVMVNDPAALYYFTGRGGIVLPNAPPEVIPEIAARYDVRYLLLEGVADGAGIPAPLMPLLQNAPFWLIPVAQDDPTTRLYEIRISAAERDE